MGLLKFKGEESKEFYYNDGNYEAVIQGVAQSVSKSGKDCIEVTLKGEFSEMARTITARLYDTKIGREQLFDLVKSVGLDPKDDVDSDELQGRYVGIEIKEGDPYNDKRQWNVVRFFALDADTSDDVDVDTDDWSDAE